MTLTGRSLNSGTVLGLAFSRMSYSKGPIFAVPEGTMRFCSCTAVRTSCGARPFGGKQRQIMVDLNQGLMQSKGLAPQDVLTAVQLQNLIVPSGTAKMGPFEYDIRLNASPRTVPELSDLPVKVIGNSTIYLRDVANVLDGFPPQTNIVRQDSHRGALVSILKAANASTLDVVKGIRGLLPRVAQTLPPELKILPLSDQSIFVRGSVNGVIREAIIAACLTGLMILLFLGSWRSTLII